MKRSFWARIVDGLGPYRWEEVAYDRHGRFLRTGREGDGAREVNGRLDQAGMIVFMHETDEGDFLFQA